MTLQHAPESTLVRLPSTASVIASYSPRLALDLSSSVAGPKERWWESVQAAVPRFHGHLQPRIPMRFGYYEPSDLQVHEEQFALGASHGVTGFCYDFPWLPDGNACESFADQVAKHNDIDVRYVVAWIPSSLQVRHGQAQRLAGAELAKRFSAFWADERYLRRNGRPLLVVRAWTQLVGVRQTLDELRSSAGQAGFGEPIIVGEAPPSGATPLGVGFELAVPDYGVGSGWRAAVHSHRTTVPRLFDGCSRNAVLIDYERSMNVALAATARDARAIRAAVPSWDESALGENEAKIAIGDSVELFRVWVERSLEYTYVLNDPEHWIIFAGAWNAWRQGNYLEPDLDIGDARLGALFEAVTATSPLSQEVLGALARSPALLKSARQHIASAAALAQRVLAGQIMVEG